MLSSPRESFGYGLKNAYSQPYAYDPKQNRSRKQHKPYKTHTETNPDKI